MDRSVSIVEREALVAGGMQYSGRNERGEIPDMWDNGFLPRMGELDGVRRGEAAYGIARAIPGASCEDGFEYLAAVEVEPGCELPDGMVSWGVQGGTFAVVPADDVADLSPACGYFYREWLPQSEYEHAGDFMMEVYPPSFADDNVIYVHFPIRPRSENTATDEGDPDAD